MKAYFRQELEKHPAFSQYSNLENKPRSVFSKLAKVINKEVSQKIIDKLELIEEGLIAEKDWLKPNKKDERFSKTEMLKEIRRQLDTNRPYNFVKDKFLESVWKNPNSKIQQHLKNVLLVFLGHTENFDKVTFPKTELVQATTVENETDTFPRPSNSEMEIKLWKPAYKRIVEGLAGVYEGYEICRPKQKLYKMYYSFDRVGNIKYKNMEKDNIHFMYGYIDTFFFGSPVTFRAITISNLTKLPWGTAIYTIPKNENAYKPNYLTYVFVVANGNICLGKMILIKIKDTNFDDLAPESCELDSEECLEWRKKYPQIDEYLFQKNDFVEEWF